MEKLYTKTEKGLTIFKKEKLTVKVFPTREAMGTDAANDTANAINELLQRKDEINMIFAAAPSQQEFMQQLISDKSIDWSRINAFHMDEYLGLKEDAPQGFGNFLKERLFSKVPFKSIYYINGQAQDPQNECERYAELLTKYPVDIVCLGIGENGHIAFNDPHVADFNDPEMVKIVDLDIACRTQQVNEGQFSQLNLVPTQAITITIPGLLKGDYMYCMVPAKNKAEAVYRTLNGEIDEECPATILRTKENAMLYLDEASASKLKL